MSVFDFHGTLETDAFAVDRLWELQVVASDAVPTEKFFYGALKSMAKAIDWHHSQFPHWWDRVWDQRDWLYAIPQAGVDLLPRLFELPDSDAEAETAFTQVCEWFPTLGIDASRLAINDPHLPRKFLVRRGDHFPAFAEGLSPWQKNKQYAKAIELADGISRRMPSILGHLHTDPGFVRELADCKDRFEQIPSEQRPNFPLVPIKFALCNRSDEDRLQEFTSFFKEFCSKWELDGLRTWDVSMPRGPHWPQQWNSDGKENQSSQVVFDTPIRFPLGSRDDVGSAVRVHHREQGKKLGIESLGSHETFAEIFWIGLIEKVLNQRYPKVNRSRDFVAQLQVLIGRVLGLSEERVAKLRKARSALLRGKRPHL